jgi:hypothetical protein
MSIGESAPAHHARTPAAMMEVSVTKVSAIRRPGGMSIVASLEAPNFPRRRATRSD